MRKDREKDQENTYILNVSVAYGNMISLIEEQDSCIGIFLAEPVRYNEFFMSCAETATMGLDVTTHHASLTNESVRYLTSLGVDGETAVSIVIEIGDMITGAIRRQFPDIGQISRRDIRVKDVRFDTLEVVIPSKKKGAKNGTRDSSSLSTVANLRSVPRY